MFGGPLKHPGYPKPRPKPFIQDIQMPSVDLCYGHVSKTLTLLKRNSLRLTQNKSINMCLLCCSESLKMVSSQNFHKISQFLLAWKRTKHKPSCKTPPL